MGPDMEECTVVIGPKDVITEADCEYAYCYGPELLCAQNFVTCSNCGYYKLNKQMQHELDMEGMDEFE